MSIIEEMKSAIEEMYVNIQSLVNASNTTTGKANTDLTASVRSLIAGYGVGGGETVYTDGVIKITPKVLVEFNGTLDDMNTNEEYPSTEYYGTYIDGIGIEYGKHYLVEYNGQSYELHSNAVVNNITSGVPDLSTAVYIGNAALLYEWVLRQSADSEDDAAVSAIVFLLLAIMYGVDMVGMDVPFQLIRMFSNNESIEAGSTLFLVNNGVAECDLRITEFKIEVEHPVNEHLQSDYLQFDEKHPGYVKNKLAGIEPSGLVFFDGLGTDLVITPSTDSDGEVTGWSAPLNTISGMDVLTALFQLIMGYRETDLRTACMIVKIGDYTRMLYLPSVLTRGPYNEDEEKYLEELETFMDENPYKVPFLDADEPCNIVVMLDFSSMVESDETAVAEGDSLEGAIEEEADSFSIGATIYTNLVNMPTDTHLYVELGWCKSIDRKFLPEMHENDLPSEALTYTRSSMNLMIRDSENHYEYIVVCKNGTLETYCRCASIDITTNPTKMSYNKGDNFDKTGMVVTATCQDGTTKDVTSKCTSDYDYSTFSSTGTKTVTISFYEAGHYYRDSIEVTVSA